MLTHWETELYKYLVIIVVVILRVTSLVAIRCIQVRVCTHRSDITRFAHILEKHFLSNTLLFLCLHSFILTAFKLGKSQEAGDGLLQEVEFSKVPLVFRWGYVTRGKVLSCLNMFNQSQLCMACPSQMEKSIVYVYQRSVTAGLSLYAL